MLSEYVHDSKGGAGEASRIEALAKVSRAYERQIKKGVLGGGKLVRLMLIQVPWLHIHIYIYHGDTHAPSHGGRVCL